MVPIVVWWNCAAFDAWSHLVIAMLSGWDQTSGSGAASSGRAAASAGQAHLQETYMGKARSHLALVWSA